MSAEGEGNEASAEQQKETKPKEGPAIELKPDQPKQESMRSVVLTGYGGYNKLQVQKYAKPKPVQGQVVVKVHACGLNFADLMVRQGWVVRHVPGLLFVPGHECAGVVVELGEAVSGVEVGARVACIAEYGSWTEYACVPANQCFIIPEAMSFEEAAAIPITYLTAYFMLFHLSNLGKRKSVLIHMAAGGVGTAATQLCKTVEGVTVFGTSSASKHELITENGVTRAIDYHTTDYVQAVRKFSPDGVDIVLDSLGGADSKKGYELLKPMGILVCFGFANYVSESKSILTGAKAWLQGASFNPGKMMGDNRTVCGFHLGKLLLKDNSKELIRDAMNDIFKLYNDGVVKPVVDTTWAFEDVGRAMQRMHDRKNIGKVILSPMKEPEPAPPPQERRKSKKEHKAKPKAEGGRAKAEEGTTSEESKPAEEGAKQVEGTKEEEKKEEGKEEAKEESKEEGKEEAKEESKEGGKEEAKEESKEGGKEETKEEKKKGGKEEAKEESKEGGKEETKEEEKKEDAPAES